MCNVKMKIKLGSVRANPFRNIEGYPLNFEKVEALKKSIHLTGFWDNLVGREKNGEVQIAYGHHRLEAARQLLGDNYEMDLNIRDLDDATMIQIMASENMAEWSSDIKIVDESVRVAGEYLEKLFKDNKACRAEDVAKFLGWPIGRVSVSFARRSAVENGDISKDNLSKFKNSHKAANFIAEIKKHDFTEREVDRLASRVNDEDTSRHEIKNLIKIEAQTKKYGLGKNKKVKRNEGLVSFEQELFKFVGQVRTATNSVHKLTAMYDKLKNVEGSKAVLGVSELVTSSEVAVKTLQIFVDRMRSVGVEEVEEQSEEQLLIG
jgi:hypothetical protein